MPTAAIHWPFLAALSAAAFGLLRRRVAADRSSGDAEPVVRRPTVEDLLSARPNDAIVHAYAYNGCTDREIADRFGLAEADLRTAFGHVLRATRGLRAYMLRKAQTEAATAKLNVPMLSWLGRNELGQSLSPTARGEPEPALAMGE
jgi:hypothetical protein